MPTAGADLRSRLIVAGSRASSRVSVRIAAPASALKKAFVAALGYTSADVECREESPVEHSVGFIEHEMLDSIELA